MSGALIDSPSLLNESVHEEVVHVRADRMHWDLHNLFISPFGEFFRFRYLIQNIISRDLKVRYKRSILGIAWTIVAPLMTMLILWTVFTYAFRVDIPHYSVYLLSGIVIWNLFAQSSAAGANSVLSAAALIQKVRLPRVIFPIAAVFNNLVNFTFAFVALLILMVLTRASFHVTIFLVPVMLVPVLIFSMGWAMLMSSLAVFFRDLQYILEISLQALFYFTPIMYDPKTLPGKVQWIVSFNPIAKFIHLFRSVVYAGELPPLRVYGIALAMALAMFLIGWISFQRLQRRFAYWL